MSKIQLPIAELKPALVGLGKVVSRRTTLPVLGTIKIDRTRDSWITLTATDLDAFVTVRLEEPSEGEPVSMLVSHDDLNRFTKGCSPGETLIVEQSGPGKVQVHYPIGGQTATAQTDFIPADDFPPVPKVKGEAVPLPDMVRQSLHAALECVSDDETRAVINGAYLDVSKKDGHCLVGTDGRHLYAGNSFTLPLTESFIIPHHAFLGWKEFNRDGEWQVRLAEREKKDDPLTFQVSSRRWRFIHKAIDGNYPNWRQILFGATNVKTTVQLAEENLDGLAQLIKRLPEPPKDPHHTLGLKVEKERLLLQGRTAVDQGWTQVEVHGAKITGPSVTVYLNRQYVLKALSFGLARIELQEALSAMRFTGNGSQVVIMPVRVDAYTAPTSATPKASSDANGGNASAASQAATPRASGDANGDGSVPASSATNPAGESNGDGPSVPVHSEAETTEGRNIMPKTPTAAVSNGNGTNGRTNGTAEEKPAVEAAIEKIETIKGSYREAIQGLNGLSDLLKQVQREQKTTNKEVQSVRSTLEKLQTVRI
jgi:DNA polymerase III sliding clamp (beta) subunit (PCNA family)